MSFIYHPADCMAVDGSWELVGTNIYIQDCKSYSGFYAVNQDFLDDPEKEYILHVGQAKTLVEAKRMAMKAKVLKDVI